MARLLKMQIFFWLIATTLVVEGKNNGLLNHGYDKLKLLVNRILNKDIDIDDMEVDGTTIGKVLYPGPDCSDVYFLPSGNTSTEFYLTDGSFYGINMDCIFTFVMPDSVSINVHIDQIDLEAIEECYRDQITVYSYTRGDLTNVGQICYDTNARETFIMPENIAVITFHSNSEASGRGFRATFWSEDVEETTTVTTPEPTQTTTSFNEDDYLLDYVFPLDWMSSLELCRYHHLDLLNINSEEEDDRVRSFLLKQALLSGPFYTWTSGMDITGSERWVWMSSGEKLTFWGGDVNESTTSPATTKTTEKPTTTSEATTYELTTPEYMTTYEPTTYEPTTREYMTTYEPTTAEYITTTEEPTTTETSPPANGPEQCLALYVESTNFVWLVKPCDSKLYTTCERNHRLS